MEADKQKRTNSTGTFQQRADGRWHGRVMVNGKRHHVYGKTEKEVDREIRKLVAKAERGEVPASGQWTVGKYLEHWLENVIGPNRRATTYRDYRNTIYKHAIPEFGRVRLTKLEPHHLEKLYAGMRTKGLAAKTIKNAHGTVHTALQHALRQGVVVRNVAEAVDPPKAGRTEIHVFTPEQARSLRDVIAGSRWEAIIALAMASGMRQGELLGLRWRDVDLDARRVHVSRQLDRDKNLTETKTAKGRRVIDLPAFVVESLRSHRARQLEHKLLAGPDWEERDLVFTTYAGRPLMARNVIREYAKVLVRAGLPHVEFHGLRHTAATLMLVQGVPAKVVQEMLGHSQISVTLDTYSHVMPGMGRDAASRMQDLFV